MDARRRDIRPYDRELERDRDRELDRRRELERRRDEPASFGAKRGVSKVLLVSSFCAFAFDFVTFVGFFARPPIRILATEDRILLMEVMNFFRFTDLRREEERDDERFVDRFIIDMGLELREPTLERFEERERDVDRDRERDRERDLLRDLLREEDRFLVAVDFFLLATDFFLLAADFFLLDVFFRRATPPDTGAWKSSMAYPPSCAKPASGASGPS